MFRKFAGSIMLAAALMAVPAIAGETEDSAQPAEENTQSAGEGTGLFAMEVQEDGSFGILWKDDTFGNTNVGTFFKTAD